MRLMLPAALIAGLAMSTAVFAAPAPTGKPSAAQQRALARCDKIKAPDSRQACQNRATATKPVARKPTQNAQRKPAAKKPTAPPTATAGAQSG
jgi:hypothetical protein